MPNFHLRATSSPHHNEDSDISDLSERVQENLNFESDVDPLTDPEESSHVSPQQISNLIRNNSQRSYFYHYPAARGIFERSAWVNGNCTTTCRGCSLDLKTNRLERIFTHGLACTKVSKSLKEELQKQIDQKPLEKIFSTNDGKLNLSLTKLIIKNNLPFRLVDDRDFLAWVGELNKNFRVASRDMLSKRYVKKLASRSEEKIHAKIIGLPNHSIQIEYDHWGNCRNKLILGVCATLPDGLKYLISLTDVTLEGHSADVTLRVITEKLGSSNIPPCKINSFVSDSAAACKRAREDIVKIPIYKHALQHRCWAHHVNNMGKAFRNDKHVAFNFEYATKITSFINNHRAIAAKLDQAGYHKIPRGTDCKWYTFLAMINGLIECEEDVKPMILANPNVEADIREAVSDSSFWTDLWEIREIMNPLVNCIAVAERSKAPLSETVKAILEYGRFLFKSDWHNGFICVAVEKFLQYFSFSSNSEKIGEDEFGLLIAAYALDRRYKLDYITESTNGVSGQDLVIKTLIRIASMTGYTLKQAERQVLPEYEKFIDQENIFASPASDDLAPSEWWSSIEPTSNLRYVALRLARLNSSSANLERIWSVCRFIESPTRTRFSIHQIERIAKIKLFSQQNIDDEVEESDEEEIECESEANNNVSQPERSRRQGLLPRIGARIIRTIAPRSHQNTGSPSTSTRSKTSRRRVIAEQNTAISELRPTPEMLSQEGLKRYREFCKIFDFNIVNQVKQRERSPELDEQERDIDNILQRFKRKRLERMT